MNLLKHRKIKRGHADKFAITLDSELKTRGGYIFREPIDITGWEFELYVHKGVELSCKDVLFGVRGDVLDGKTGKVYFAITHCQTQLPPGTYWYTVQIIKPNKRISQSESAKFIITESLNPYYSIYKE